MPAATLAMAASRTTTTARRPFPVSPYSPPIPSASRTPLRHARFLSQSARTPTAAPAPRQPPPAAAGSHDEPSSSSASSSTSSATSPPSGPSSGPSSGPPSFYALFPKTFPRGPPPAAPFPVDVRALRTEFLHLQAAAHPDFHHHASSSLSDAADRDSTRGGGGGQHSTARARAEALSSLINEAYRTLASPLLRAQYLLRQNHGIDLAGDESTLVGNEAAGKEKDMELLMAVLEVREDIERAADEADLEPIRQANDARMRASEAELASAFAADDAASARREAVRLRYWVNIDDALRNWERGKDIVLEH